MTASDYLQFQALLLNSLENIKTVPAREFAAKLDEIERDGLTDYRGKRVEIHLPTIRKVFACSQKFVEAVRAEPPKYYQTEVYRMECLCGERIESPTPSASCKCGREIRVEWQAELPKPKPVTREKREDAA